VDYHQQQQQQQQHGLRVILLCLWHTADSKKGGDDATCGPECSSEGRRGGRKTA